MTPVDHGFTPEQRQAIRATGTSVALTAGAGCGKTFVLTERFLSHLQPDAEQRADLNQLVAFTFTERAAREMRDRIRSKCRQRLQHAEDDDARYWLELWRDLDTARVTTIHSFCATFLQTHAVEAKLDPSFRVLNQAQADTLLAELIDDQIRASLAQRDEGTINLILEYGLPRTKAFVQTLVTRFRKLDWSRWLAASAEDVVAAWKDHHQGEFLPAQLSSLAESPAALRVVQVMRETVLDQATMRNRQAVLLDLLPKLADSQQPLDDLTAIREAAKVQGAAKKTWPDEHAYETFKREAALLRKEIDQTGKYVAFDNESVLSVAQMGCDTLQLSADVVEQYDQAKRERAVLDFEDLLIRTSRLLTDPIHESLRRATSSQIHSLLVDEFQDTDQTQVELVKALCGDQMLDGKLFFVGDKKQSIYRFRGAQPDIFEQLRQQIPAAGRLPLSLNFRSQPGILHFVNAIFSERFGESYQALQAHRTQVIDGPNVEFMWAASDEKPRAAGAKRRARQHEADWIARRICELLEGSELVVADEASNIESDDGESDDGGDAAGPALRVAQPGDVVILFRALSDVAIYEEALRNHGIDYYLVGGHAFYAQQEIFDLLNLLRSVTSGADEVSLAGVLRSPMFGLTDEALFWLAKHPRGLNAGLMAPVPSALGDQQQDCVLRAAETIRHLRDLKDRLSVADLINEALRRTGYDAVLLAEFLGQRKLANLHKLIHQARENDHDGFSLSDFIVQLSQFVADQPREALAATQAETANVVRLMTIHQAKGLEFPLVIVPDLARGGDHRPAAVALSDSLGPLLPCPKDQESTASTGLDMYRFSDREGERSESDRLFYVACTRAADYLLLSSSVFPDGWPSGDWPQLMAERFDLEAGELHGTLRPGFERPMIRVTSERPAGAGKAKEKAARLDLDAWQTEIDQIIQRGAVPSLTAVQPVAIDLGARRRFSFSQLTSTLHAAPESLDDDRQPGFGDPASGTESDEAIRIGTLVHRVLEHIDFGRPADVEALIRQHASRHRPNNDRAATEAARLVQTFLSSTLATELALAQQIHREVEFMLAWPPGESHQGTRYLHGTVDCLYQDTEGAWRIVDYKTNQVGHGQLEAVASRYEMQMFIYAMAAEQVLNELPQQLSLFFLRPGTAYDLPWNDEARSQGHDLVNCAMETIVDNVVDPA